MLNTVVWGTEGRCQRRLKGETDKGSGGLWRELGEWRNQYCSVLEWAPKCRALAKVCRASTGEWGQSRLYVRDFQATLTQHKARFPVLSVLQPWTQTPYPWHMCCWNSSMTVELTCFVICHSVTWSTAQKVYENETIYQLYWFYRRGSKIQVPLSPVLFHSFTGAPQTQFWGRWNVWVLPYAVICFLVSRFGWQEYKASSQMLGHNAATTLG